MNRKTIILGCVTWVAMMIGVMTFIILCGIFGAADQGYITMKQLIENSILCLLVIFFCSISGYVVSEHVKDVEELDCDEI